MSLSKVATGIIRKLEFRSRVVAVMSPWGQLQEELLALLRPLADERYSVVSLDVWNVGASSDTVPCLLWRIAEASGDKTGEEAKKITRALAYVAASVVAKAAGVDFRAVVGALNFVDEELMSNPSDRCRELIRDLVARCPRPVLVLVEKLELAEEQMFLEIVGSIRFLLSASDSISFVVLMDLDGSKGARVSRVADCFVHLPRAYLSEEAPEFLDELRQDANLSDIESEALESLFRKTFASGLGRLVSAQRAAIHFVASRKEIVDESVRRIAPFLLWLKYEEPDLYGQIVWGNTESCVVLLKEDADRKRKYSLVVAENVAVGADLGSADSDDIGRLHRIGLELERSGV